MRYPPHILEEIRARLPASDIVGRRVRLKKAGREWRGLSPFNAEKSPSFYVNDQKQFYHCFSSGKHGDVFTFLMETEGLSFPEAVERLAAEAGVTLPAPSADAREQETKRAGAFEVMEMAAAFFEEQLRGRAGTEARAYLDRRQLGPEIRSRFRLGYAPGDRYALRDHLAAKDVDRDLMIELGLLVAGEDIRVPYDKFRDRVMFPIADSRGRVIAFGGRAMQKDAKAKYMNSPETPLFHKGQLLYNLHQARKPAHDRGVIIAVEGYVDVIAMTLAGHPNAVAGLGTALTEEQIGLLWRNADEPILCFDGDGAGQRAAFKALDVALPGLTPGKSLRFAMLPEGQDPDDLLRAEGKSAIDRVLDAARPLVEVLWSRATDGASLDTPERRAGLAKSLREMVASIRDETVRGFYRDEIEGRLRALSPQAASGRRGPWEPRTGAARPAFQRTPRPGDPPPSPTFHGRASNNLAQSAGFNGAQSIREGMIVGALLTHPSLLDEWAEQFSELDFENEDARSIQTFLLDAVSEATHLDPEVLESRLQRAKLEHAAERVRALGRRKDPKALDAHADPVRLEDALRQAVILHRKSGALNSELRLAERALVEDETEANFAWLCDVKARMAVIAGAEADEVVPDADEASAP
ncbi:DNA primase [Methylobacterium sp. Leaf104]|uniref:DNA primase n=1 Tax=Methylobacterium TaxID=407 RepID=UPI0006F43E5B|nr:DNA primase [Methylobacterium sp. Leaf104]KQP42800.1 DNA primase [Methylobacterium sp. Leaf104]MCI9878616.1 DNA primase [Methylobacterium goesingense]